MQNNFERLIKFLDDFINGVDFFSSFPVFGFFVKVVVAIFCTAIIYSIIEIAKFEIGLGLEVYKKWRRPKKEPNCNCKCDCCCKTEKNQDTQVSSEKPLKSETSPKNESSNTKN